MRGEKGKMKQLIDKEAFIKELNNRCRGECCCCLEATTSISGCKVIDEAPVIDAVPVKHGEWVVVMAEEWCTFDECKCSVCGVVEYFNKGWKKFSYCPNCGARMEAQE